MRVCRPAGGKLNLGGTTVDFSLRPMQMHRTDFLCKRKPHAGRVVPESFKLYVKKRASFGKINAGLPTAYLTKEAI